MNRSIINKLLLAKRLYWLAQENLRSDNDLALSVGTNLLQDSVESFLLAIAEHTNAGITSSTSFQKYFELINAQISPKELSFQARLIGLNKLRVNSKHYGLAPSKSELDGLIITVIEFFSEISHSILNISFSTVSLLDLVKDGEEKGFLREAKQAFENGEYAQCLIACRKALYIRFESGYDISPFDTDNPPVNGLSLVLLKAPYYARNKKYINEHVKDPTDYIVYDHNKLLMDLMELGIDTVSYWNVWRLTPPVYRKKKGDAWIVKEEFNKIDEVDIKQRAEYVLDTTVDLSLLAEHKYNKARSPNYGKYSINLKRDKVPIYEKADKSSKITCETPVGIRKILADSSVVGFDNKSVFWHVNDSKGYSFRFGYIKDDDVVESR